MDSPYDVIVVGGGAAGLAAACFAGRARRRTLVLERELFGGQLVNADVVESYLGHPDGILGADLSVNMRMQALKFGAEMALGAVTKIELQDRLKAIHTEDGVHRAKAVIVASGTSPKKLGVPGEEEFYGRGVSHCATCDGAFFQDQVVAVVGGGNAALEEGLVLARYAAQVLVIHRRDQLRATPILQERARNDPKFQFLWNSRVEAILGKEAVEAVRLVDLRSGARRERPVAGVFPYIGRRPNTEFLVGLLPLAPDGSVPTNERLETALPGLFAGGEVRQNSAAEAIAAAGDGASAAIFADRYLQEHWDQ